jgi:hypothetical protein
MYIVQVFYLSGSQKLTLVLPKTLEFPSSVAAIWGASRNFTSLTHTEPSINQHCGEPGGYPTLWGPVHLDRPPTSLDLSDIA